MTAKEIRAEVRTIRKAMRAQGVRVVSCFNGGLTPDERMFNAALFALKARLERASIGGE